MYKITTFAHMILDFTPAIHSFTDNIIVFD